MVYNQDEKSHSKYLQYSYVKFIAQNRDSREHRIIFVWGAGHGKKGAGKRKRGMFSLSGLPPPEKW